MGSFLKDGYKTHLVNRVLADARQNVTRYSYFIGRTYDWPGAVIPENDETDSFEMATRSDIIFSKFVPAGNLSATIPKRDWISGTVYDQYDDTYSVNNPAPSGATSLKTSLMYVRNQNNEVFKCLFNADEGASTTEPTSTTPGPQTLADGYIWIYLYTIPQSLINKFEDATHMPVFTSTNQKFYSNGVIGSIAIVNGGTGYTTATVTIDGDGSGAVATANINAGTIESISVDVPGIGYTYATLTITGDGTGAVATSLIPSNDLTTPQANAEISAVNGAISHILITDGGTGYDGTTTLVIDGDGNGATATPTIIGGVITAITITNYGEGYTTAVVSAVNGGAGFSGRVIVGPAGGHGKNAVAELFADSLTMYGTFDNSTDAIDVNNSYHQYGIISNIENHPTTSRAVYQQAQGTSCFYVTGSGIVASDHLVNDVVSYGNDRFRIISLFDNSALIAPIGESVVNLGIPYVNERDNLKTMSFSTVDNPTINRYSGQMLMVSNSTAFTVAPKQYLVFQTKLQM